MEILQHFRGKNKTAKQLKMNLYNICQPIVKERGFSIDKSSGEHSVIITGKNKKMLIKTNENGCFTYKIKRPVYIKIDGYNSTEMDWEDDELDNYPKIYEKRGVFVNNIDEYMLNQSIVNFLDEEHKSKPMHGLSAIERICRLTSFIASATENRSKKEGKPSQPQP